MRHRIWLLLPLLIVSLLGTPAAAASPFVDLGAVPWAAPAVNTLYARHLVAGLAPGRFAPGQEATWAQTVTLLVKALYDGAVPSASSGQSFSSAPWSAPYAGVAALSDAALPADLDSPLTRGQAAQLVQDLLGQPGQTTQQAMTALARRGVLAGVAPGRLAAAAFLTRAQLAVIAWKLLGQVPRESLASVRIGSWQGTLPVASTPLERHLGLMQQPDLAASPHPGMVFAFPTPELPVYWMYRTPEPLELLYIRDGKVGAAIYMPPCLGPAATCPRYPAPFPVTTAVELAPGIPVQLGDNFQLAGP
ncbi:MAG: S-layer homology domain-containing protein [Thermaerobacter sp.]|nr:S-layer homology domain-containing protein [Thermaerobacter sp.]